MAFNYKPYKQLKRALQCAGVVKKNTLVEKVDILVREYGEYEKAGEYSETAMEINNQ